MDKGRNRLSFKDIAGIDDIKAEVEELVAFLKNPNRFLELGARAPAGVLLVGNPGTGQLLQLLGLFMLRGHFSPSE